MKRIYCYHNIILLCSVKEVDLIRLALKHYRNSETDKLLRTIQENFWCHNLEDDARSRRTP